MIAGLFGKAGALTLRKRAVGRIPSNLNSAWQGHCLLKRHAPPLTAMILLWSAVVASAAWGQVGGSPASPGYTLGGSSPLSATQSSAAALPSSVPQNSTQPTPAQPSSPPTQSEPAGQQEPPLPSPAGISGYEGKLVQSIEIPGVAERDREDILQLLAQKVGEPLDRGRVRD